MCSCPADPENQPSLSDSILRSINWFSEIIFSGKPYEMLQGVG